MIRRVIATGQETELFRMKTPGDGFFSPSLSPDEKQIAFLVSTGESEYTLVAIPVAGGAPRELYHCPKNLSIGLQHALAWTNDGRHLLALGNQSGRPMLWSFAVEGGEPQASSLAPITSFARPPSISVHPDSKRIAISGGQNRQELWVMRGLLREAGRSR